MLRAKTAYEIVSRPRMWITLVSVGFCVGCFWMFTVGLSSGDTEQIVAGIIGVTIFSMSSFVHLFHRVLIHGKLLIIKIGPIVRYMNIYSAEISYIELVGWLAVQDGSAGLIGSKYYMTNVSEIISIIEDAKSKKNDL